MTNCHAPRIMDKWNKFGKFQEIIYFKIIVWKIKKDRGYKR